MRGLDSRTIEEFGIPGEVLMDTAGRGVAEKLLHRAELCGLTEPSIAVLAGRGNNGGDAFVAARYLAEAGMDIEVWLAAARDSVSGDALIHLKLMLDAGVRLHECDTVEDWRFSKEAIADSDILLDGLLGTGVSGPVRGPICEAISLINDLSDCRLVVSIDIPSGLNADTGEVCGSCVCADLTVSMALPKVGMLQPIAYPYVGNLEVVDIGIPPEYLDDMPASIEFLSDVETAGAFSRRRVDDHKGRYGHLLIIAGAAGYTGAPVLAARAALRSGVGLVTILVPESMVGAVSMAVPEAMVHGGAENTDGSLSHNALDSWMDHLHSFSAVMAGPGMTTHADTRSLVEKLLAEDLTLVLDADALNVVAGEKHLLTQSEAQLVLTPHPGEMARLAGVSVSDIQADRLNQASRFAEEIESILVLKGAGSVVAIPGQAPAVNLSGNPGMACGGMGDVLSGFLGGLASQFTDLGEAAKAAVYIHGRAGDIAAASYSQSAMKAGDVIEEIPSVMRELCIR
jgi:NAD(P)H-hydrate epimerase